MSIPFSGTLRPAPGGIFSAILKQLRRVDLKPVKKINIRFDPFHEHVTDTRLVFHDPLHLFAQQRYDIAG
jgi:large subunit ribosomal protein L53